MRIPIRTAAATLGLIAAAATASPALGDAPVTLNLSAPSTPIVGKPIVLQATGTVPVNTYETYWLSVAALPTSVTTTCPTDHFAGKQLALSSGGSVLTSNQREAADPQGNFSIPIGATPSAPGTLLLCAYTDDGYTNTLAVAPLTVDIQPTASTPSKSAAASGPTEAIRGIRSCLALLSPKQAKGCIRSAIKRGEAKCRKLRSKRDRATCLRAVRLSAKSG